MSWTVVEDFNSYVIRLKNANEYVVDFEVISVTGEAVWQNGKELNPPVRHYEIREEFVGEKYTEDIEKAARFIEGSVKWDGCSHVNFAPEDGGYVHFCGKKGAVEVGAILAKVYELAKEMMGDKVCDEEMYDGV